MTILLVVAGIIALVVLFEWWGRKPLVHKGVTSEQLRSYLEILLTRGYEGGLMFIRPIDADEECFLQYAKHGTGNSSGLRFAFPKAPWSAEVFPQVTASLRNAGFPVLIEETEAESVPEFAVVNLGNDLDGASEVATASLDAMGLSESALNVWFEGVAPG